MTGLLRRLAAPALVLAAALLLGGCNEALANRLAALPVMTTDPGNAEVIERRDGREIGTWPTTAPMAIVTYRPTDGDARALVGRIRQLALDNGWTLEEGRSADVIFGEKITEDGRIQLSAYARVGRNEVVMSVWRSGDQTGL